MNPIQSTRQLLASQRRSLGTALILGLALGAPAQTNAVPTPPTQIRYAAIGDSYSNGEGATPEDAWPTRLARQLTTNGVPVKLVANPSITGWTTQQALDEELPVWTRSKPDFATLQIGVNDWVQGIDAGTFRQRLASLLDAMLGVLPDKTRLLVVNIPDFSVTPNGALYGGGRDISRGLAEFNQIIADESAKRGLKVVDVFPLSQKMRGQPELTARDGLHPSAKEYALWEEVIYPLAHDILAKPTTNPPKNP